MKAVSMEVTYTPEKVREVIDPEEFSVVFESRGPGFQLYKGKYYPTLWDSAGHLRLKTRKGYTLEELESVVKLIKEYRGVK